MRLVETPLFAITLTVAAYELGRALHRRFSRSPWLNPVPIAVAIVALALAALRVDYASYFRDARLVHLVLGPATVALAVPLHRELSRAGREFYRLGAVIALGSFVAVGVALGVARALGATRFGLASLAPKSVTTPIAMGLAERIGGDPALAAALVIVTGMTGAVVGPWWLTRLGVGRPEARGLALGVAAHGIGTATAFTESSVVGAFAGLGLGLNGVFTALWLPIVLRWMGWT